jgi:hypothetical protein
MCDSRDTNVQGGHLFPDEALRYILAQVFFYQKPHTAVLLKIEVVETHTLLPIERTQHADCGSEPVNG